MENQKQFDLEFLEHLQRRYNTEITKLKQYSHRVKENKSLLTSKNTIILSYLITFVSILITTTITTISFPFLLHNVTKGISIIDFLIIFIQSVIVSILVVIILHRSSLTPGLPQEYDEELEEIRTKLADLTTELEEIKKIQQYHANTPLGNKSPTKISYPQTFPISTPSSEYTAEDCDHWRQLLSINIRVIRELELQAAAQGTEFHYSKKIELEERHLRVSELQQRITQNC